jgi:hypothetical protein
MFCDGCGGAVQAGQAFCSKCGKQIVGVIPSVAHAPNRVQHNLQLLGIFWLAMGAFNVVGGAVLLVVGNTFFSHLHELGAPPNVPTGFLAGWGLMQREPWARVVTLVLAFISLFNIPFGTAVGIYTLWVLLPGQAQQEYDALVAARAH